MRLLLAILRAGGLRFNITHYPTALYSSKRRRMRNLLFVFM